MIKTFREILGITQKRAAEHLGISRSHLAMTEVGERDLPGSKSLALTKLVLAVIQKEAGAKPVYSIKETDQAGKEMLQWESKKYNHMLFNVEKKLAKLRAEQERYARLIANEPALQEAAAEDEKRLLDLVLAEEKVEEKRRKKAILKLEISQCSCESILAYLKKRIES